MKYGGFIFTKARKKLHCYNCRTEIPKGDYYNKENDDQFCLECVLDASEDITNKIKEIINKNNENKTSSEIVGGKIYRDMCKAAIQSIEDNNKKS